jgi:hypothetical protein
VAVATLVVAINGAAGPMMRMVVVMMVVAVVVAGIRTVVAAVNVTWTCSDECNNKGVAGDLAVFCFITFFLPFFFLSPFPSPPLFFYLKNNLDNSCIVIVAIAVTHPQHHGSSHSTSSFILSEFTYFSCAPFPGDVPN